VLRGQLLARLSLGGKRTLTKSSLDKDLKKVVRLEVATHELSRSFAPMGLASSRRA
jgi:hypothetical protein